MEQAERLSPQGCADAVVVRGGELRDQLLPRGRFVAQCFDRKGRLKWEDAVANVVTTEGKNLALDTILAGSAYSVVGPFMGLITSTSPDAGVAAGDTAAQINGTNGWREAGGANLPTYTGNRKTCVFAAAASAAKALSAALSFAMTGTGIVKGCFILYGAGALSTKDDANGKLLSAGFFSGGDKTVASGDTVNVSYQLSM